MLRLKYFLSEHAAEIPDFLDAKSCVTSYLSQSLKDRMQNLMQSLSVGDAPVVYGKVEEGATLRGPVYVAKGARVETGAMVVGPCFIGENAEVRHGAYIRGNVYIGAGAVVGHATEVKGSVFCSEAKAGHFAYVGDSFLGPRVNLGAGTKCANLKLSKTNIKITLPANSDSKQAEKPERFQTGLKKLGGLLAAGAQTGCNSVLSPGSILGPGQTIMPCEHFMGTKEG